MAAANKELEAVCTLHWILCDKYPAQLLARRHSQPIGGKLVPTPVLTPLLLSQGGTLYKPVLTRVQHAPEALFGVLFPSWILSPTPSLPLGRPLLVPNQEGPMKE